MSPQKPETGFLDRLGGRFLVKGRSGEYVEILIFRDELVAAAGFEAAVRGEVARLADFRHASIRRIRGVARLAEPDNRLALVSDSSPGKRLSEILAAAEQEGRPVTTRAMLSVVREVLAAVHALHEASGGVCHGALGPERVVVAPDGRVLVVEHVLGSALDCHTAATQEKLWRDYRVAVVEEDTAPRFGQRTDVLQIGLIALALVLGRALRRDEFPRRIGELLLGATETGPLGSRTPLGLGLRAWIARAVQFGSQDSYATVGQALSGLEQILGVNGYVVEPSSVLVMLAPQPEQSAAQPSPAPASDSGPHAVAAPAQHEQASARAETAPRAVPVSRPETAIPHRTTPVGTPSGLRIAGEAAAPDAGSGPVSMESLSTPAGVECIAADVRVQAPPVPRSGPHRAAAWGSPVQPQPGTSRQPAAEVRLVQTPPTPASQVFGVEDTGEMPPPVSQRRWMVIGAAAAALLLAAGIPGVWLLTRTSAPPPVPVAVEAPPAPSDVSMDRIPAGPPAPSALRADSRAEAAKATTPPAAPPAAGAETAATAAKTPDAGGKAAEPAPVVREGRIAITAPLPMQIIEKGYALGASPGNPISLPVGRHEIEIVNDSIGYRDVRAVDVTVGRTVPIVVSLPKGSVSFNAIPWAEVWADGQKIGETPVANVEMSAGPHEVSFRHPQLGERKLTVVVPVNGPQRVSMDMRKQ
jgi:serine/threonine-protein kinase